MTATPEWRNRIKGYSPDVDPADLLANPLNPRRHPGMQRDMMRFVLDDVGWVAPVIVNDRTGRVLDGHMRVEEALSKGETVPVVYVDVSQVDEERVVATFNAIGYRAAYDRDVLDRLLNEVGDIGNDPLEALLADLSRAAVHFDDKALVYTAPIPDHGDAGPVTTSYTADEDGRVSPGAVVPRIDGPGPGRECPACGHTW